MPSLCRQYDVTDHHVRVLCPLGVRGAVPAVYQYRRPSRRAQPAALDAVQNQSIRGEPRLVWAETRDMGGSLC